MGRIENGGLERLKGPYQLSDTPFGLDQLLNKNPKARRYLEVPSLVDRRTLLVHFYEAKELEGPAKAYETFIKQPLATVADILGLNERQRETINPLLHALLDSELAMKDISPLDHEALTIHKSELSGSAPAQQTARVYATNVFDSQYRASRGRRRAA